MLLQKIWRRRWNQLETRKRYILLTNYNLCINSLDRIVINQ